jgi:hypothetical protein
VGQCITIGVKTVFFFPLLQSRSTYRSISHIFHESSKDARIDWFDCDRYFIRRARA